MLLKKNGTKRRPLFMWRHEKGKNEKGSVCERYARETHYACL